jgi:hypothetical protein
MAACQSVLGRRAKSKIVPDVAFQVVRQRTHVLEVGHRSADEKKAASNNYCHKTIIKCRGDVELTGVAKAPLHHHELGMSCRQQRIDDLWPENGFSVPPPRRRLISQDDVLGAGHFVHVAHQRWVRRTPRRGGEADVGISKRLDLVSWEGAKVTHVWCDSSRPARPSWHRLTTARRPRASRLQGRCANAPSSWGMLCDAPATVCKPRRPSQSTDLGRSTASCQLRLIFSAFRGISGEASGK